MKTTTSVAVGLSLLSVAHGVDLQVQAGYHVIYSYEGTVPPTELSSLIEQGLVGGVLLFSDNVDENLPAAIESWQSTYKNSSVYAGSPLLIMTDQEGGEVKRLPGGPTSSEKVIGEASDPEEAASQAGSQAASALEAYNMNANLAPVLDVFRTPGDFDDQYQRSYSDNATLAGVCGAAFIAAQQSAGYIATAKHFPGLGAAASNENTDEVPVTLNITLNEIRSIDEVPYQSAIAAGLDMVMPSWALYPAFDSQYPSGLSEKWIQQELRARLGFKGVTISDAIEAGALKAFGDDSNRALLASRAGMDIILAAAQNVTQGQAIVKALADALGGGTLDQSSFDAATQRILSLRRKVTPSTR
ncbi:putative glycosyl hydrolase [Talaromyces proteolyticus]|uniref:Glycosyl hydrolase n=1 Tax=Talaromyces proteolyticus TaxID=1131652 RepID=A0AAD4L117_9EURO|nr:putative glycosyl hydrolase [Talaromyces proteolyticus]KAH8700934.1 putative glycosyl hydrolase [Talaromyces proteolyticus]